jgi:hypothetical protein
MDICGTGVFKIKKNVIFSGKEKLEKSVSQLIIR